MLAFSEIDFYNWFELAEQHDAPAAKIPVVRLNRTRHQCRGKQETCINKSDDSIAIRCQGYSRNILRGTSLDVPFLFYAIPVQGDERRNRDANEARIFH